MERKSVSLSSKLCCLYNQVVEVEQASPLSLKRCAYKIFDFFLLLGKAK